MTLFRLVAPVVAAVMLSVPSVSAQSRSAPSRPAPADWQHGSTVSVEAGAATDTASTGMLVGGALGWELMPKLMFEGGGRWLNRVGDATGFNAALKVRAGLRRSDVSPFVEAGVGLYRLSASTLGEVPTFYQRRIANGTAARQVFTDPSFHVGAGVNVFVARRLAIQPAAEAMVVTRSSDSFTTGMFSLRVVYHFEDHPVTPSR